MNDLVGRARKSALIGLACTATLVLSVLCAGCGERDSLSGAPRYPVTGKILLADGKPLTTGSVSFVGPVSVTAKVESDGSFTFKTPTVDGLPEGEYRVSVDWTAPSIKGKQKAVTFPFAQMYRDEDSSKLKATVTTDASKNNFEWKLEAKDTAAPSKGGGRPTD